ncbi:MAG: hypothetical protein M1829_001816 [Trizodia sp. TS-e1964]|nr:MAG: hypothetical protein M1829_001816 [Trizodia sp. TS-e1964]
MDPISLIESLVEDEYHLPASSHTASNSLSSPSPTYARRRSSATSYGSWETPCSSQSSAMTPRTPITPTGCEDYSPMNLAFSDSSYLGESPLEDRVMRGFKSHRTTGNGPPSGYDWPMGKDPFAGARSSVEMGLGYHHGMKASFFRASNHGLSSSDPSCFNLEHFDHYTENPRSPKISPRSYFDDQDESPRLTITPADTLQAPFTPSPPEHKLGVFLSTLNKKPRSDYERGGAARCSPFSSPPPSSGPSESFAGLSSPDFRAHRFPPLDLPKTPSPIRRQSPKVRTKVEEEGGKEYAGIVVKALKARPFACNHVGCNKRFQRREHLKRHWFVHSGEKPYECEACNRPFSRTDNLRSHYKTHVGPNSRNRREGFVLKAYV